MPAGSWWCSTRRLGGPPPRAPCRLAERPSPRCSRCAALCCAALCCAARAVLRCAVPCCACCAALRVLHVLYLSGCRPVRRRLVCASTASSRRSLPRLALTWLPTTQAPDPLSPPALPQPVCMPVPVYVRVRVTVCRTAGHGLGRDGGRRRRGRRRGRVCGTHGRRPVHLHTRAGYVRVCMDACRARAVRSLMCETQQRGAWRKQSGLCGACPFRAAAVQHVGVLTPGKPAYDVLLPPGHVQDVHAASLPFQASCAIAWRCLAA
jgi:hypothetical protein